MREKPKPRGLSPYAAGLRWRGQYVSERRLPEEFAADPVEFLRGWFFPFYFGSWPFGKECWSGSPVYATNRELLDEAAAWLMTRGIDAPVRPFVNCECNFGLYPSATRMAELLHLHVEDYVI